MNVVIEMDLDGLEYSRLHTYGALDLLSDVGGFVAFGTIAITTVMAAWNFNAVDKFMIRHLFKIKINE